MKSARHYILQLDILRCLAIIFVILQHAYTGTTGLHLADGITWSWVYVLGHLGVPFFIIISGFFYLNPAKNIKWKDFFLDKVIKIGIPFVITLFCYFKWLEIWEGMHNTWEDLIGKFVFLDFNYLYFIPIILGLYCITPLIRHLNKKLSSKGQVSFLIILFLVTGTVELLFYTSGMFIFMLSIFFRFLKFLVYYYFGFIVLTFKERLPDAKGLAKAAVLFFFTAVVLIVLSYHSKWVFDTVGAYFVGYTSFSMMTLSFFAFLAFFQYFKHIKLDEKYSNYIHFLARDAFGIYLIHWFYMYVLDAFLIIPSLWGGIGIVIIAKFGITLLLSWGTISLARKVFERVLFSRK